MNIQQRIYTLLAILLFFTMQVYGQDKPIGYWEAHMPYNSALGVAVHMDSAFVITNMAFYSYDPLTGNGAHYSKVEGMSDVGMQCVGYDLVTNTVVLVYADGNIDLFRNNTFYNIPDLKIKSVAGTKAVYNVYTQNGIAYLATSLGILVVDLTNMNVKETYTLIDHSQQTLQVNYFTAQGAYYYAVTTGGLYRAAQNDPALQNYQDWQKLDSTKQLKYGASLNNVLYLSDSTHIYALGGDTLRLVYTTTPPLQIQHLDSSATGLLVSELNAAVYRGDVKMLDGSFQATDSIACTDPRGAQQLSDGSLIVADAYGGLLRKASGASTVQAYSPSGPNTQYCQDVYAYNKNVWVAHGGYSDKFVPNGWGYGMSNLVNGSWNIYRDWDYAPFWDSVSDISSVIKDQKDGTVYAASMNKGLFVLKPDGSYQIIGKSVFDVSRSTGGTEVLGLALDASDNLWVSPIFSQHQLYVKTPDNVWYKFEVPGLASSNPDGGQVVIDDNNQVWFVCGGGSGVTVYYPGDLTTTSDDVYYHLSTGVGTGNLPSNNVYCLAKDQNNNIWVGTDNGIGIVSNCDEPFTPNGSSAPCDAEIPIVQYDQFAGYLFAGYNVRTIAVDGANRKWVGTDNGAWLLSPDASQIVYRFTAENSPLPSDLVQKITIDKVTGDVYFGTDHGLVSYHSGAIDGGTSNSNVTIFPNPVRSDYQGTIAIKGLSLDADVRITDIDGQLVYRTKALGSQAVWNGLDYQGHRPQSGVYLIFTSSSDGTQTYAGKIIFIH